MAERVEAFLVATPAATAQAAPLTTALSMNPGVTRRLEILVPPGPSGLVGFQLLHSGTVVIPESASAYFIADDAELKWDLDGYPTGNKWSIRTYNTDIYPHTLYLRWFLDEIPSAPAPALVAVPIE